MGGRNIPADISCHKELHSIRSFDPTVHGPLAEHVLIAAQTD
jgi:hypothetical protein